MTASIYTPADLELAQRLERAEAAANAAYVDSRRELQPETGADWMEIAGAYAMFDGASSPLTQTFGLGVFESFLEPQFAAVEKFFRERGAATFHEVCAFAAPESLSLLSARGYVPIEASAVLVRPTSLPTGTSAASRVDVRIIEPHEPDLWAKVAAQGWSSESEELAAFVEQLGTVMSRARGVYCFLARLNDQPVAAAALNISRDVALLAGASTIPAARRRGAQQALLEARLRFAADHDIDLAMIVTQPGSASQRNAQRQGFRAVYTRAKWQLDTQRP